VLASSSQLVAGALESWCVGGDVMFRADSFESDSRVLLTYHDSSWVMSHDSSWGYFWLTDSGTHCRPKTPGLYLSRLQYRNSVLMSKIQL
jgi:hypothetical protein